MPGTLPTLPYLTLTEPHETVSVFSFLLFLQPLIADHFLLPYVFVIHAFFNSRGNLDTLDSTTELKVEDPL